MTIDAEVIRRLERRYRLQDALFSALDDVRAVLSSRPAASCPISARAARILLANGGHIGDMIMSTAVAAALKDAMPHVEIGVLTGTYNRPVLDGHPLITRVHFLDHWYLSREQAPLHRKFIRYRTQRARIVRELAEHRYDVAIDLRIWFPNFVPVLAAARIPVRIAYDRVGGGRLLTHRNVHRYDRRHEVERQLALLSPLGIPDQVLRRARPVLAPVSESAASEAEALIGRTVRFCILHPAASVAAKDWPLASWMALANDLVNEGMQPIITGRGARDAALAQAIAEAVPGCINLCDRLSWGGLTELIRRADAVYSVDTAVAHVAAALGRATVVISGGMADPRHWKPYGPNAVVATNPLPCHPCFRKAGCAHRRCLTEISVAEVRLAASAAERTLGDYERP